jgi:hypothetical protein
MGTIAEPIITGPPESVSFTEEEKAEVLRELQNILKSPAFRTSARGKQFLSYVVQQKLQGHDELLKERTIGTEIFQRKPDYSTADDSVVRVQAGEVRRRLEQYYHAEPSLSPVHIELPLGSYAPEFRWHPITPRLEVSPAASPKPRHLLWAVVLGCGLALLASLAIRLPYHRAKDSALDQFWSPVFATSQPVLICVAKPVFYRPSLELYRRYSKNHPGTFQSEVERYNQPLPLDANEKLVWSDMLLLHEYGVAVGDVYLAARLSALFERLGKPSQVRIGAHYSFEDLRNSPAVMVGAFNNPWTLQMTSNLRFSFVEKDGSFQIQEQGSSEPPKSRVVGPDGEILKDFAVVTRLLDSKTGQVLIAAAGVGAAGTQAAGEFISRSDYLEEAFRRAPSDWQKKNLQVVLETAVTDSVAGPPRVVANYFW